MEFAGLRHEVWQCEVPTQLSQSVASGQDPMFPDQSLELAV